MKKIIILLFVVLLTGCDIKIVEMNHYEIDEIPYKFPLKYKQSNESNEYYHCYQLDKNNKITLKAIDVESMATRKDAYAFLKNEIYQAYHTEENVKKRSYQSDNTDKPGYRYEIKNKNNKKAGGLVYGTFATKNKVIIFSYEYKAGRDEDHESEYEYLMSDTKYENYD